MKLAVYAFINFLVGAALFLPQFTSYHIPEVFYLYGPMVIMLIAMLFQFEVMALIKNRADFNKLKFDHQAIQANLTQTQHTYQNLEHEYQKLLRDIEQITSEKNQLAEHVSTTQVRLADSIQEVAHFKKALEDTQARLAQTKEENTTLAKAESVLTLISLLQSRGRFVDFTMEDISQVDDERVGRAARIVHAGCRDVLKDFLAIKPLNDHIEGSSIELSENFNNEQFKLLGTLPETGPYRGKILHRGWMTEKVNLPKANHFSYVITPAEVQIQ